MYGQVFRTIEEVRKIFAQKAMERKKRTLFVEMTESKLAETLRLLDSGHYRTHLFPFAQIIEMARKNGWEIQALDKESIKRTVAKKHEEHSRIGKYEIHPDILYAQHNLRERHWANKVRQMAGP